MEENKQTQALITASVALGAVLQDAARGTREGTFVKPLRCGPSEAPLDICVVRDKEGVKDILLRAHDDFQRCEHFAEPITASLRLADCLMHGAGALRRVQRVPPSRSLQPVIPPRRKVALPQSKHERP